VKSECSGFASGDIAAILDSGQIIGRDCNTYVDFCCDFVEFFAQ
jgi:hypothetical protein